jgi:hypothetical protein
MPLTGLCAAGALISILYCVERVCSERRRQKPGSHSDFLVKLGRHDGLSPDTKYPTIIAVSVRHAPSTMVLSPILASNATSSDPSCRRKILLSAKTRPPTTNTRRPRSRKYSQTIFTFPSHAAHLGVYEIGRRIGERSALEPIANSHKLQSYSTLNLLLSPSGWGAFDPGVRDAVNERIAL